MQEQLLAMIQRTHQLEQQVQECNIQLQQAFDFEAMLKRITDKVRDSLDENQILQAAVQELALGLKIICCDAALYNLDEATSIVCYQYTTQPGQDLTPSYRGSVVQMVNFSAGYCQLLQGQYFQFCELEPYSTRSHLAILACPISDHQGVLGDMWLFRQGNQPFNELEVRLVQQVANQGAITMRQSRLYQTSLTQVEQLEKRIRELKDNFLSTVSHELQTPLVKMKLAIYMLQTAPTGERWQRYLEILKTECARESKLIDELLRQRNS